MRVTLKYYAQLRQAAGTGSEEVELETGADLVAAIRKAAESHGEAFRSLVLAEESRIRPSLLIVVNSETVPRDERRELSEGDEVSIFSPVAGG